MTAPRVDPAALARLAHLALDPDQLRTVGTQLGTIVGYLRMLEEVDVKGVAEFVAATATVTSPLRLAGHDPHDGCVELLGPMDLQASAPRMDGPWVAVPKFR